jgi:molybdopterin/thiamine biosynthesis adenylyltransferase
MAKPDETARYARQIPVFGRDGQKRLKDARVFIAGAGGLGTVISTYLALAGVGYIRIADCDHVEVTDLNRQILHWEEDIGKSKADSIREKLVRMNPHIDIDTMEEQINPDSAERMTDGCELLVDALDNFAARYLLNRIALKRHIPFFHGAINSFYGQTTTIQPFSTPCLRCIFPNTPEQQPPPVIGTTCCFIGAVQANEVLKYICNTGELLRGKLLLWDGMRGEVELLTVEKNPTCPDCRQ